MLMNQFPKQNNTSCSLQNFVNRWIELCLPNGYFFKFYLTYLDQHCIGGYLSRGSYNAFYCTPSLSSMYLYEYRPLHAQPFLSHQCINKWITLVFGKQKSSEFFLTYINENFIGGYLTRDMIETFDPSIVHYQLFFEEYDRRFHPMLLPQNNQIPIKEREKRIQIVSRAEAILMERVKKRAVAAKNGKTPNQNDMPSLDINDIQYLSNTQVELYKEFFLDEQGNLDYKRIQRGFELFDNGEIQSNKYPGNLQPDSASDFSFAEFALQAIENNVHPEIWSELLKTFVKTQEIFIQVYRPDGIEIPTLGDYSYSNFRYYKQVSENKKERLRKKYDSMSKDELEQAYGKNLIRAQSAHSLS
jgi:hypothetical protein